MPKRRPKKDASQTAVDLVRDVTGGGKVRGESLLGSPALRRKLREARIKKIIGYGPHWLSHQVWIDSEADLDDELRSWLRESHDIVGLQAPDSP